MSSSIDGDLTTDDKLFIAAYIRHKCNGTRAQKEISPDMTDEVAASMASQRLRKIKVKEIVERKLQEIADLAEVDAVWALKKRRQIVERCMQSAPVVNRFGEQVTIENEEGEIVPAYTFDSTGANKALDAIEKIHLGMMEKKKVVVEEELSEDDRELLESYVEATRTQ